VQEAITLLEELLRTSKPLQIALLVLTYVVMGTVLLRSEVGKRVFRSFRFLFYSEPGLDTSTVARRRLIEVEHQVEMLRRTISGKNIEARREALQVELENQLTQELPALVKHKLAELKVLDVSLDPSIQSAITSAVGSYFDKYSPEDTLSAQRERARVSERHERAKILEQTIEEQMRSAGRLKAVMINLFVLFNIGVLLVYLFAASNLSDRAVTAIIGLYVSLAAFIVYIYRTSNFRSSVLLALREDAKKYYDADDYLRRLKPGASPSERDVEVLKLLMLNRAEREKMADHPYELVLKGISNSNIQFKGGKIIPTSKSAK
jgi:hypothetical protein